MSLVITFPVPLVEVSFLVSAAASSWPGCDAAGSPPLEINLDHDSFKDRCLEMSDNSHDSVSRNAPFPRLMKKYVGVTENLRVLKLVILLAENAMTDDIFGFPMVCSANHSQPVH